MVRIVVSSPGVLELTGVMSRLEAREILCQGKKYTAKSSVRTLNIFYYLLCITALLQHGVFGLMCTCLLAIKLHPSLQSVLDYSALHPAPDYSLALHLHLLL
ncbi:uncharacterized protein LOC143773863 [Ranitomeya variabilis]|uniref:uncharacterized protein LOC143773863 n=1 Tax=Ranitomeya variabilis TaxID=490064 RepID=UPI004055D40D